MAGVEHRENLTRQTFGVRARRVAFALVDNSAVVDDRDASGARRGVKCEDSHEALSFQLSAVAFSTAES